MSLFATFVDRYAQWVVTRPRLALVLSLLLVGVMAPGNGYFNNTLDYRFFFSDDNPQLAAYERLQQTYGSEEFIFVAIEPAGGDVFNPRVLAAIEHFTREAWQIPFSRRVDSLTNFQYTVSSEDSFDVMDLFAGSMQMTAEQIRTRRDFALAEPALRGMLVAADGSVAGLRLVIRMPDIDRAAETPEVVFAVRDLARRMEQQYPFIRTYLSGQVVVDQSFPESTQADFNFVWPAFFVVMTALLMLIFRSVWFTVFTMLTGVLAIAAGMGAVGWTGLKVNAAVTVAPIMILTLAMADCIHILSNYSHNLLGGKSRSEAMADSVRVNFGPVMLTSFMTLLGFLSLHFNDSPPYRALGYVVASGVVFAWIFSIVLLPALLMLTPHRLPKPGQVDQRWRLVEGLSEFIIVRQRWLTPTVALLCLAIGSLVVLNRINDDPVKYFGPEQTMRQHMEFVNQRITGLGALNYSLRAAQPGGVFEPDYLQRLEAFSGWLERQPGVSHVDSAVDVVKRINKSWHNDDPAYYRIPESGTEVAQLLLAYELSLPFGADMNDMITMDKDASRVRVTLNDTSGNQHIRLDERAQAWLQQHAPGLQVESASAPLMFAHIGERSIKGLLQGLVGSLFLIAIILWFLFRSWVLGVVSVICNVLPVVMAFGAWGLVNGQVDLGLTVTLGIAFGIVVDDTIHFLTKYTRARRELKLDSEAAVRYTFSSVGPAIVITSVVLLCGFAMLGFSQMNITANTSVLTCVTVGFALIVDLLLVPGLLLRFDRSKTV